jgi:hypothetical protein
LGATPDHGGGCLVPGDVLVRLSPVLVSPCGGVGGVDREQADAVSVRLRGEPVPEDGGGDSGHGGAETFTSLATAHRFPAGLAGICEVQVFDCDGAGAVPQAVVDQAGDAVPDLGVAAAAAPGEVEPNALGSPGRVAV